MLECGLDFKRDSLQNVWFPQSTEFNTAQLKVHRLGLPEKYPSWRKTLTITPSLIPNNFQQIKNFERERKIGKEIALLCVDGTVSYFAKLLNCSAKDLCIMHCRTIIANGKSSKCLFFILPECIKGSGYMRYEIFSPFSHQERLWYTSWEGKSIDFIKRYTHKHFSHFIDLNCLRIYKNEA